MPSDTADDTHDADFYRREADRLLMLARSIEFGDVGDQLVSIAERYRQLAAQNDNIEQHPEHQRIGRDADSRRPSSTP